MTKTKTVTVTFTPAEVTVLKNVLLMESLTTELDLVFDERVSSRKTEASIDRNNVVDSILNKLGA